MMNAEFGVLLPNLKELRKGSMELPDTPLSPSDRGGCSQGKARFESMRARVKKLSLKTFDHLKSPSASAIPLRIELMARSRVADAGLNEFAEKYGEFRRRYKVSEVIAEVS